MEDTNVRWLVKIYYHDNCAISLGVRTHPEEKDINPLMRVSCPEPGHLPLGCISQHHDFKELRLHTWCGCTYLLSQQYGRKQR